MAVVSPKQRAANRANAMRSTGPRSEEGKFHAKLNATKHGLSLPVDERVFADLIQEISSLIRQIKELGFDPYRLALAKIAQAHRNKQAVSTTFTLPQKRHPVKLKGKDRTDEIKFIDGFLRIQDRAVLARIRSAKNKHATAERYQKRAINQLAKGIRTVASGEKF